MFEINSKMNITGIIVLAIAFIMAMSACSQSTQETEPPAYHPKSGDEDMALGGISIDSSEIIVQDDKSPEYALSLEGYLPTPCHHLRVEVIEPTKENEILFDVYSVSKPDEICAQVLEPFDAVIPIPELPAAEFVVLVNGEQVGEIPP